MYRKNNSLRLDPAEPKLTRKEAIIENICGLGILNLFFLMGAIDISSYDPINTFITAPKTYDWPSTSGVVIANDRRPKPNTIHLEYAYQVSGIEHRGHIVQYSGTLARRFSTPEAVAGLYPIGSPVVVYYDPAAPDTAVLVRGTPRHVRGISVLVSVYAAISFLTLAWFIPKHWKISKKPPRPVDFS